MGHDERILDAPWPKDLDPSTLPFATRTATVLRRQGIWDDMTLLDDLSENDVLSWWNAGVKTVEDLRRIGNQGIDWHQARLAEELRSPEATRRRREAETERLRSMTHGLAMLAYESWTAQVWWRDRRFAGLLPRRDATVRQIALDGSLEEHRQLWAYADELTARIQHIDALTLQAAVAGYVEAISGQHGIRLEALLARTGLGGRDPITGREAADMLGVSYQRIQQIVGQLRRHRNRAKPPDGVYLPQLDAAIRHAFADTYTQTAVQATRQFFDR